MSACSRMHHRAAERRIRPQLSYPARSARSARAPLGCASAGLRKRPLSCLASSTRREQAASGSMFIARCASTQRLVRTGRPALGQWSCRSCAKELHFQTGVSAARRGAGRRWQAVAGGGGGWRRPPPTANRQPPAAPRFCSLRFRADDAMGAPSTPAAHVRACKTWGSPAVSNGLQLWVLRSLARLQRYGEWQAHSTRRSLF